ncbi:TPA: hypothetical protein O4D25_002320 [Proteus mirabilis]|nr:hypothetical protein [Proteus mirabilis]
MRRTITHARGNCCTTCTSITETLMNTGFTGGIANGTGNIFAVPLIPKTVQVVQVGN